MIRRFLFGFLFGVGHSQILIGFGVAKLPQWDADDRFQRLLKVKEDRSVQSFPQIPTVRPNESKETVKKKVHIHSSGTEGFVFSTSKMIFLNERSSTSIRSLTRTTQIPKSFHLRVPQTSPIEKKSLIRRRTVGEANVLVDVDDERDLSAFNELDELDPRIVPFQPKRNLSFTKKPNRRPNRKIKAKRRGENFAK